MPDTTTTARLLDLLLQDHQAAKQMLERFDDLPVSGRAVAFCQVTYTLVGHEVAEEEVLYPAVREHVENGDDLAGRRIEEQAAAEELLARMEKLDPASVDFMAEFANLRDAVLEHAEAEEQTVFPALASAIDEDEQRQLGRRYEQAKAAAPTHPHPHAPDTPPGNLVLGPVAAVVDRVRDAARKIRA
jgi:hemerythrin superfamily protein